MSWNLQGEFKPLKEEVKARRGRKLCFYEDLYLIFFSLSNRFFTRNLHHCYSSFKDAGNYCIAACLIPCVERGTAPWSEQRQRHKRYWGFLMLIWDWGKATGKCTVKKLFRIHTWILFYLQTVSLDKYMRTYNIGAWKEQGKNVRELQTGGNRGGCMRKVRD